MNYVPALDGCLCCMSGGTFFGQKQDMTALTFYFGKLTELILELQYLHRYSIGSLSRGAVKCLPVLSKVLRRPLLNAACSIGRHCGISSPIFLCILLKFMHFIEIHLRRSVYDLLSEYGIRHSAWQLVGNSFLPQGVDNCTAL